RPGGGGRAIGGGDANRCERRDGGHDGAKLPWIREAERRDGRESEERKCPDPDGTMQLREQLRLRGNEVDRESMPPLGTAAPPENAAAHAHDEQTQCADSMNRGAGAACEQMKVQLLQRADRRAFG